MVLIERATRARRMAQAQAVTIVLTFFAMLPNKIFIGHGRNIILRFGEINLFPISDVAEVITELWRRIFASEGLKCLEMLCSETFLSFIEA